jgi:hypothetical protein
MPSPYVKQLAKDTGKSDKEIERLWNKAKEITADTFGKPEKDWGEREYGYTTGTVKNMLGINEELSAAKFVNSDKSAKEFIEETMVSGNFNISNVTKDAEPKDKEDIEGLGDIKSFDDPEMDTAWKDIKITKPTPLVPPKSPRSEDTEDRPIPENYTDGSSDTKYLEDLEKWEEEWEKINSQETE